MSKLRKAARGQECTVQIHPYCNGNPETVVLCHAPSERKGMGIKSPDHWGAFGCSTCHDVVDGRMKTDLNSEEIYRCHIRGVFRTQNILIKMGLINVNG